MKKILFSFLSVCQLQSMYLLISLPTPFLHLRSLVSSLSLSPLNFCLFLYPRSPFSFYFLIPFQTVSLTLTFSPCLFSLVPPLFSRYLSLYLSPILPFSSSFLPVSFSLRLCIFISLPLSAPNFC